MEYCKSLMQAALQCFYIVNPSTNKFKDVDEVPNYHSEALPVFVCLVVIERILLWFQGKRLPPLNDGLTSLACGILNETGRIMINGGETFLYLYIYNNYRLCSLPWDSTLTWILALVGVDFCFYWAHRTAHEINLFWSQHQVHHSSEEFNLTTGFRESLFEGWFGSLLYLPMAFLLPPSVFVVHLKLNFLYQTWIHTEVVENLGILELIFNTPSHHRVHHAANRYCIDKNYGGFLIIWDRLFGTFAAERKEEKLVYGLIDLVQSFNPLHLQFFYWGNIWTKIKSVEGLGNKISAVLKGPGWIPGSPRTGFEHLLPEIKEREKYQRPITMLMQIFQLFHFGTLLVVFHLVAENELSIPTVWLLGLYVMASLTSISLVYDNSYLAPKTELLRSVLFLVLSFKYYEELQFARYSDFVIYSVEGFYVLSALYWSCSICKDRPLMVKRPGTGMKHEP